MSATTDETERNAMEELLPWYAAGTLDARDAKRVERALLQDAELAQRYELVREEFAATIEVNEALGTPSARVMDALFTKIAAEPERKPPAFETIAAYLSNFAKSLSPNTLAWSAVAAAVLIVVQAATLGGMLLTKGSPTTYQTASAPASAGPQSGIAIVRFDPQASAADIDRILEMNGLMIVSGPAPGGLFQLGSAKGNPSDEEIATMIRRLQQERIINFIAAKTR